MKTTILAVLGLACVGGALALGRRPQGRAHPSMTRLLPLPPGVHTSDLTPGADAQAALDAGDDAKAARLLEAAQAKVARRHDRFQGGSHFHVQRMRLFARQGKDAAAVDEAVGVVGGKYGLFSTSDSRTFAPALDAAMRLKRTRDADAIATYIGEHDGFSITSSPALNKPAVVPTPALRIAYAYLLVARRDEAGPVRYAERAAALAPDEVPVLVQLADAYMERDSGGGRDRAAKIYARAYALLPEGSGGRRDLRDWAYHSTDVDPAGPGAEATLKADIHRSHKEAIVREEANRMARAEKAARLRESRGLPPIDALPAGRP